MITVNLKKCVGCRTCELACSYYHKGCFNPKYSSIRVHFADNYDIGMDILNTCDCKRDPLCVKLCPTNAIKLI